MTALLLAVAILGALCSAPAWIEYGRKRGHAEALNDVERRQARRTRVTMKPVFNRGGAENPFKDATFYFVDQDGERL